MAAAVLLEANDTLRFALGELLRSSGIDVYSASTAPEVTEILHSLQVDVAILDDGRDLAEMPGFVSEIRGLSPKAAIIVLSGAEQLLPIPGAHVLKKPVRAEDLLEAMGL